MQSADEFSYVFGLGACWAATYTSVYTLAGLRAESEENDSDESFRRVVEPN